MATAVSDVFSGLGMSAATQVAKKKELGQADFLRLMVSQIQNQDPLKPLESTQFLAQLAQFSTVAGITELNSSFSTLSQSLHSNQALQASGLVGERVLAPGDVAVLGASGNVGGALDLEAAAGNVQLQIVDATGATVRTMALGARPAGLSSFSWDGVTDLGERAAPGAYQVRAVGNVGGSAAQAQVLPTLIAARVDSVDLNGANGLTLNLAGLGPVEFNQVRQILPAGL